MYFTDSKIHMTKIGCVGSNHTGLRRFLKIVSNEKCLIIATIIGCFYPNHVFNCLLYPFCQPAYEHLENTKNSRTNHVVILIRARGVSQCQMGLANALCSGFCEQTCFFASPNIFDENTRNLAKDVDSFYENIHPLQHANAGNDLCADGSGVRSSINARCHQAKPCCVELLRLL